MDEALLRLLPAWGLGETVALRELGGANNQSWLVDTAAGAFVIRLTRNQTAIDNMPFVHALLSELAESHQLPFAVPVPCTTSSGQTMMAVEGGVATVTPFIAGRHPISSDASDVEAAGEALGQLIHALGSVQTPHPESATGHGDLARVHPAGPDPIAAVDGLGLDSPTVAEWRGTLDQTLQQWTDLPGSLPWQINHVDYVVANVLLDDSRVVGVLDFEFAAPDYRAMDFAGGIQHFGLPRNPGGPPWPLLGVFAAACFRTTRFTADEIEALPALWLRRQVVRALHWIGRWRAGHSSSADAMYRLDDMFRVRRWLASHSAALNDTLLRQLNAAP